MKKDKNLVVPHLMSQKMTKKCLECQNLAIAKGLCDSCYHKLAYKNRKEKSKVRYYKGAYYPIKSNDK